LRTLRDEKGIEKKLGAELARGGEGVIYRLDEQDDVLVKVYHSRVLENASAVERLQRKIKAMAANQRLRGLDCTAWPRLPLFDTATGRWCGYAMRRQPGISLQGLLGAPQNLLEFAPGWNRLHLVHLCLDFLGTIQTLSAERTLPVDFNPCNFLVDVQKARFHFIDCDGYQFQDAAGTLHLCEAVRPDLAAPELLQRCKWDEAPVTPASLRFSVGMVLFFILNLGSNPYRHRNGNDPVDNLRAGVCGLGKDADCPMPPGPWYVIWSHLSYDLKNLFIRCFRDGHGDPAARPSVAEWRDALQRYEYRLRTGRADAAFIPARPKAAAAHAN
jgi:DNA-binding helix-hairpin-helix protein with protein kinase domain